MPLTIKIDPPLKSQLAQKALEELLAHNMFDADADYGPSFAACIVKTVETFFTTYGHSGGSAELGTQLLERLLRGESL